MSDYSFPLTLAEPGTNYQCSPEQLKLVDVLVNCPDQDRRYSYRLYTYKLPVDLAVKPGDIVCVPFRSQTIGGIAMALRDELPQNLELSQIKEVEDIIASGFFSSELWQVFNQLSDYYCTSLLNVIRLALPPGLLGRRSQRRIRLLQDQLPKGAESFCTATAKEILQLLQATSAADRSFTYLKKNVKGASRGVKELVKRGWVEIYFRDPSTPRPKFRKAITLTATRFPMDLTKRQREVLRVLRNHGGDLWLDDFVKIGHTTMNMIGKLEEQGCVVIQEREVLRRPKEPLPPQDQAKELTPFQTQALHSISSISEFSQILLHGITGSGKTEVYLQAIAPILEQGKSALVLVPEIGLTPQLTDRFRARFGDKIMVYHSGLNSGERYDAWRQMLRGEPQIIIGTRSAVFAPLKNLGIIILDEEHDSSFKESQRAPTYHARTVAKWRAQLHNCPLVMGSATPSLESWSETQPPETLNSPSTYLSLPERIQSRPLPPVEIVDLRRELKDGNRSIFSRSLQNALEEMLRKGQQGILFIPRRGHSTFVSCRTCGYVMECPQCDVSLSYHHTHEGATELLRCHYCNHSQLQPRHCPECGSPYFKFFGTGTQRVTKELSKYFPEMRFIRFDSDTTRRKGAHRQLLSRFTNHEADLLIGTQMLTKGLDISQVTLVGVVSADGLLHRCDYRAAEMAFQTLTQVAGRAGRGNEPGKVIIQTYSPEHPVISAVQNHDYQSFVEKELEERQALEYPPYGRLILLKLSGLNGGEVEVTARLLAEACEKIMDSCQGEVLGPAPATIMRVKNRCRWRILLKFSDAMDNNSADLLALHKLCPNSVRLTIDVDPINMD